MGQVSKPGAYELSSNMSFLDALALAGGPNDNAQPGKIVLARPSENFQQVIDLGQLIKGGGDANYALQQGDIIYVPKSGLALVRLRAATNQSPYAIGTVRRGALLMGAALPLASLRRRPTRYADQQVRDALTRNLGPDIAARVGYLVSRVFIPPFVLARLGLEMYGLWSTAFILVSYLGIGTFGISAVYVKFVAEYAARGETEKANSILSTGVIPTAIVCIALVRDAGARMTPTSSAGLISRLHLQHTARDVILLVVAIFLCDIATSVFRDSMAGRAEDRGNSGHLGDLLLGGSGVHLLFRWDRTRNHGPGGCFYGPHADLDFALGSSSRGGRCRGCASPFLCTRDSLRTLLGFGGVVQLGRAGLDRAEYR